VNVVTWLIENPQVSGIYNVGSGQANTFNEAMQALREHMAKHIMSEYVEMPENLKSHYQNYTCANTQRLRQAGYTASMTTLSEGVHKYVNWLFAHD
jgi:ADP-L-glycero-D-manno-heptose 6-epimerase